jgi:hypothetical protein
MDPMQMPTTISQTQLFVMLFSVVVGILAMIGFVLWGAKHAYEERRRVRCPTRLRMARVLFKLAPDAKPTDVLRCSLLEDGAPIGCGKWCLHAMGK